MSSGLQYGEDIEWFSNRSFAQTWDLAFDTANLLTLSSEQKTEVNRFKDKMASGAIWPGIVLELEEEFASLSARKMWARIFHETAQSVFLRETGKHSEDWWQVGAIVASTRAGNLFEVSAEEDGQKYYARTRNRAASRAAFQEATNKVRSDLTGTSS